VRERLLPLALAAVDDADACIVLADAIEETGWWTRANGMLVYKVIYPDYPWPEQLPEWDGEVVRDWFRMGFEFVAEGREIGWRFIKAIVTVLSNSEEKP
jgi:hypothetical protein